MILLATLTTLVPYAYSAAAQLQMLFSDRALFDARHLVRDAVIAGLAFAYSFWMIYGAGTEVIAKGFLLMLAGVPVYVYMQWRAASNEVPALGAPVPPPMAEGSVTNGNGNGADPVVPAGVRITGRG